MPARPFLEAVGVQHVPERTCRAWLVIADTAVDQNVVVRGLHQVGLDAEHELSALPVEIATLGHPVAIFLQHLSRERWEEFQWIEERTFLLHHAVDRDIADFECGGGHVHVPKVPGDANGAPVAWLPWPVWTEVASNRQSPGTVPLVGPRPVRPNAACNLIGCSPVAHWETDLRPATRHPRRV